MLDEWIQFQLSFLITLEALQAKVLRENNSREKNDFIASLDNSHLLEIDSLWSEDELSDKIKSLIISNLLSIFDVEDLICQAKLTSLNIKKICNLTDLCLKHMCKSDKLETGKMIFELEAENFEFQNLKNKKRPTGHN